MDASRRAGLRVCSFIPFGLLLLLSALAAGNLPELPPLSLLQMLAKAIETILTGLGGFLHPSQSLIAQLPLVSLAAVVTSPKSLTFTKPEPSQALTNRGWVGGVLFSVAALVLFVLGFGAGPFAITSTVGGAEWLQGWGVGLFALARARLVLSRERRSTAEAKGRMG